MSTTRTRHWVDDFDLSTRARNVLIKSGLSYAEAKAVDRKTWIKTKNCGLRTALEIGVTLNPPPIADDYVAVSFPQLEDDEASKFWRELEEGFIRVARAARRMRESGSR